MNLEAYLNVETLKKIAEINEIIVPNVRGYIKMQYESPVSDEEVKKIIHRCEVLIVEDLCCAEPFWNPYTDTYDLSPYTDYLRDYYLISEIDGDGLKSYVGIRWDRIHGWKRKILKFEIKKKKRIILKKYKAWNKYAGQENVLYICARCGGKRWDEYPEKEKITGQSWFLDRVDDWFDSTYCDFYAKISQEVKV